MENITAASISILDQYEILTPFDTDANVFLVKDRETQELFVEKTISVHNLALYQQIKDHPFIGVPKIYSIHTENGKTILIEEYIHGLDLMQMSVNKGPFPEKEVAAYMSSLCQILDQFHRMNPPVIHKDIKPGNLILTKESELYLIDFNISRVYNPESAMDTIAMVSPHFSAPESYGFSQSDARSDIYSIGATMHYLLTGGYLNETIYEGSLKDIIEKCTTMDHVNRYQTVIELKRVLDERRGIIQNNGPASNGSGNNLQNNEAVGNDSDNIPQDGTSNIAEKITGSFLPPGFRAKKLWHIILALIGYALIIDLCFTMEIESTLREPFKIVDLWMQRISVFIFFILTIFILFDYRNCLDRIPGINRIKSRLLRRLLLIFILFSIILAILVIFVSVMSNF